MAIKITEVEGYNIYYESQLKKFLLWDKDGTELAVGATQVEVEEKAKRLRKQIFKRIPIIEISREGEIITGELTSVNLDDKSAWVSMEGEHAWGSGRQKINLKYSTKYYEATSLNLKIAETIKQKYEVHNQILKDVEQLTSTLQNKISLEYFTPRGGNETETES